jgi:hypothetical protein
VTAPKYGAWGVFRLRGPDLAIPLGPLQLTRAAAELDRQLLAERHDVHDAVLCEVRIIPKETPQP